jgi:hypothetical protein
MIPSLLRCSRAAGAHDLVHVEIGGNAIDLLEQLLARLVVIGLVGAGDGLVAVEPVEHLEIRGDGRHVARGDRLGRELHHRREAVQLQLGVRGAAVDRPFLQHVGDDLADAFAAHALFGRDFLVAQALAQAGEDPPPPQHRPMRAQPPAPGGRHLLNHACLFAPPVSAVVVESSQNSADLENQKGNVGKIANWLKNLGVYDRIVDRGASECSAKKEAENDRGDCPLRAAQPAAAHSAAADSALRTTLPEFAMGWDSSGSATAYRICNKCRTAPCFFFRSTV